MTLRCSSAPLAAPADVAVEILQVGGLQIAPAALVQPVAGDIGRCVAGLLAVLELALDLTERAAGEIGLEALIGEAVLELDVHRAAEGVEAEHRVGAFEIDLVDGDVGDQVPIHRVAERLVEAHAVDIDGEPLRRALQRRGREPVIEQGRLKRIARSGIQVDAADLLVQRAHADRVCPSRLRSLLFSTWVSAGTVSRSTPEPSSGEAPMTSTGGSTVGDVAAGSGPRILCPRHWARGLAASARPQAMRLPSCAGCPVVRHAGRASVRGFNCRSGTGPELRRSRGPGCPACIAGMNRHWRTADRAAESRIG